MDGKYRPAAIVSAGKTRRVVPVSGIAPCGAVIAPAVIDLTSFAVHCSSTAREKFPVWGHVELQRSLERPPVEI